MSIESFIGGLMMIVASVGSESPSKTVWNTLVILDKANMKTHQGTWKASAHEESYQITKDSIMKMGGLK